MNNRIFMFSVLLLMLNAFAISASQFESYRPGQRELVLLALEKKESADLRHQIDTLQEKNQILQKDRKDFEKNIWPNNENTSCWTCVWNFGLLCICYDLDEREEQLQQEANELSERVQAFQKRADSVLARVNKF